MKTQTTDKPVYKIIVIPADEKQYKAVQKSLAARGVLFSSSLDADASDKSQEELKLEAEYATLTGLRRFRLGKEAKAEVDGGKKTRMDFLLATVKELRKGSK